jgi:hypothetical protein
MEAMTTQFRFLFAAALVTLALGLGCGKKPPEETKGDPPKDNPPPVQKADPPTPPAPKVDELLSLKPDFTLKAEETPNIFGEKAQEFASKYGGKILDVTGGPITDYSFYDTGDSVNLRIDNRFDYRCRGLPLTKAMPGQTVTLRGRCDPKTGLGVMTLVRVEGDPPPAITAEQLAKDFKERGEDAVKTVQRKYLVVTGTIQKVEKEGIGTKVYLTPPGAKPVVTCWFVKQARAEAESNGWLKDGQKVRVLGEWISGELHLNSCVVVPPEK